MIKIGINYTNCPSPGHQNNNLRDYIIIKQLSKHLTPLVQMLNVKHSVPSIQHTAGSDLNSYYYLYKDNFSHGNNN